MGGEVIFMPPCLFCMENRSIFLAFPGLSVAVYFIWRISPDSQCCMENHNVM
jgi:hypothetical protein